MITLSRHLAEMIISWAIFSHFMVKVIETMDKIAGIGG